MFENATVGVSSDALLKLKNELFLAGNGFEI